VHLIWEIRRANNNSHTWDTNHGNWGADQCRVFELNARIVNLGNGQVSGSNSVNVSLPNLQHRDTQGTANGVTITNATRGANAAAGSSFTINFTGNIAAGGQTIWSGTILRWNFCADRNFCLANGGTFSLANPLTSHNWNYTNATLHTCSRCAGTANHAFGSWTTSGALAGEEMRTCSPCGHPETRTIIAPINVTTGVTTGTDWGTSVIGFTTPAGTAIAANAGWTVNITLPAGHGITATSGNPNQNGVNWGGGGGVTGGTNISNSYSNWTLDGNVLTLHGVNAAKGAAATQFRLML